MAARGPWLASDQQGAFVERVAVLVVDRHDGGLRAGEAALTTVEIRIGVRHWLSVEVAGFGEPESRKQSASRPNGTADADLAQPGAPFRWIAQRAPGAPGLLHGFLHGVFGLLDVPQDGVGHGEQPATFRVDGGIEASRIHWLLVGHDHETIESARGRLVYVPCDELVTKKVSPPISRVLFPASAG